MAVAFRDQDVVMGRGKHINLPRDLDVSVTRGGHVTYGSSVPWSGRGHGTWQARKLATWS